MQASKKHSFLRRSPLAYVVVPLAFVLVSTALVFIVGHTVLAPYQALLGWFFSTTEVAQPRDLLDNAATVINGGTVDEPDAQPDRLLGHLPVVLSGTNVDAPVYYGDTNKILNAGSHSPEICWTMPLPSSTAVRWMSRTPSRTGCR